MAASLALTAAVPVETRKRFRILVNGNSSIGRAKLGISWLETLPKVLYFCRHENLCSRAAIRSGGAFGLGR